MKVNVFVWKASKEQLGLVDRITSVIQQKADLKIEFHIQDMSSFKPHSNEDIPTITFGKMAKTWVPRETTLLWTLPDLKQLEPKEQNKAIRMGVVEDLDVIAAALAHQDEIEEEQVEFTVETKVGVSVGIGVGDIQLTESEAENLLRIKSLLGGGTVIIKKGDIRVEVEDERE
jgi:hypothetical protein